MASPERVYKVVVFGVTGCGKSSIINLLADQPVADVSTGVEACTRLARQYPVSLGDKNFQLWDTMGFNQAGVQDRINPLSPYVQAHALLRTLHDGVDLILLCARKDGINTSLRSLYWLLDSFFFGGRAQIALVLTHFDIPDDRWWPRNKHTIAQRCNIPVQFLPHVCITTVQDGPPQPGSPYEQSTHALKALLHEHVTLSTPTLLPLDLSSDIAQAAAVESLNVYCHLSNPDAEKLVETFKSPIRPFRVILFGDSGAGKSSVVNLLADTTIAKTSPWISDDTRHYCGYEINAELHQFLIWDTVGLNWPMGHDGYKQVVENAIQLIHKLHKQGGADLLVFCKRAGRVTVLEFNIFWLFHEFLCGGQVPVAFIITHLEYFDPMEKWWVVNEKDLLKAFDLKADAVAGHACITSLAPEELKCDSKLHAQRSQSRQLVQAMLEDSISSIHMARRPARKQKMTVKNLADRCGLSKDEAEELIELLYKYEASPHDQEQLDELSLVLDTREDDPTESTQEVPEKSIILESTAQSEDGRTDLNVEPLSPPTSLHAHEASTHDREPDELERHSTPSTHFDNPPESTQEGPRRSDVLESVAHSEDGELELLNVELPSRNSAALFNYEESPSSTHSTHTSGVEELPASSSHAILCPPDVLPVTYPPETLAGERLHTAEVPRGSSRFARWIETRTKKSNGAPAMDKPGRLSRKSCTPGPANPRSRAESSARVNAANAGPSTMAAGQRRPRTVVVPLPRSRDHHPSRFFAIINLASWHKSHKKSSLPSQPNMDAAKDTSQSRQGTTDPNESSPPQQADDGAEPQAAAPPHPNKDTSKDAPHSRQSAADPNEAGPAQATDPFGPPAGSMHVTSHQRSGRATVSLTLPAWLSCFASRR